MKVCVLLPDYSTTDVDYKHYDPPRNLSKLLPNDEVDHVFLNKLTTYSQIKQASKQGYDIYVNLCEGYLDWPVPSIDVIHALEQLNLPYTGPNADLYDPSKPLMKYVAFCAGVKTPDFVEIRDAGDIASTLGDLSFPLFVKPAGAGDSLGIDAQSLVHTLPELEAKVNALLAEAYDAVLVEKYIAGREFTVLVAANPTPANSCTAFKPVEYRFPPNRAFKTYALKTSELHPDCNVPCLDAELEARLKQAAGKIFTGFSGVGYARLDFRVDVNNDIYFLEINFTCSVFYEDGYEGSADYILRYDPIGKAGFLSHIIAEGKARHAARQKKFQVLGNAVCGYGIFANQLIKKGDIVFNLEAAEHRIVTKRYALTHFDATGISDFRNYAYPISDEVYVLWDRNPKNWAPQNHSCDPTTGYHGLNVVALRDIMPGEELTLDYATSTDDILEPFECTCGSPKCRKIITGTAGNSITNREKKMKRQG